jgi:hypothetical protein
MADDKRLDQVTAATAIADTDTVPVVQTGTSIKRATLAQLRTWLGLGVVASYASGASALRAYADGFYSFEARRASADANPSALSLEKSRGTIAAPASIQSADAVASITARAWDGAAWTVAGQIRIDCATFTGAGDFTTFFQVQLRNGTSTVEVLRALPTGELGIGTTTPTTALHVVGAVRHATYTVATLPSASTVGAGARAAVTDSDATTFNAVVAGGGSNFVPVISDGTDWRIG